MGIGKERRELRKKRPVNSGRLTKVGLALAGAALIALGIGYVASRSREQHLLPVVSYDQSVRFENTATYFHLSSEWKAKTAGSTLLHPESSRASLPSENDEFARAFVSAFQSDPEISGDLAIQKILAQHQSHLPLQLDSVRCAIAVKFMQTQPSVEFMKKSKELLTYFASFIDEPLLAGIPLVVPRNRGEITTGKPVLYILNNIGAFVQTRIFYAKNFPEYVPPVFSINSGPTGVLDIEIADKVLVPRHILVNYSAKERVVDGYHPAVISETGHFALNRRTQALVRDTFAKGTYSQQIFDALLHEEEVFQHALENIVLETFFKERGITVPQDHFEGELGFANIPKYKGLGEMHRRLRCEQKSGESLEHYVQRQRETVLMAKQRYFSADRTMFDFLGK